MPNTLKSDQPGRLGSNKQQWMVCFVWSLSPVLAIFGRPAKEISTLIHKAKVPKFANRDLWLQLLLLVAIIWIAKFWRSEDFGLYADDYSRIPTALSKTWFELAEYLGGNSGRIFSKARPLHEVMIFSISHAAGRLAGLRSMYFVAFAIYAFNTALLLALLRRVASPSVALLGALAFALYGADTTQSHLTLSFGGQPSISFLLLAFHAYLSRNEWLAYLLILGSLATYESAFAVFLSAPLLTAGRQGNPSRQRFLKHAALMALLVAISISMRIMTGDNHLAQLSSLPIPRIVLGAAYRMGIGPIISLGTYAYRPLQIFWDLSAIDILQASLLTACLLGLIFGALPASSGPRSVFRQSMRPLVCLQSREAGRSLLRLIFVGAVMLALSYAFTITIRPYAISGRDTRVHLAGAVGAALVIGCLLVLGLDHVSNPRGKSLVKGLIAIYFLLMGLFGATVQADYVESWTLQRRLWRDIVEWVPDLDEGIAILIEPDGFIDTRQIDANTWNLPYVLPHLFRFPGEWKAPPRAFRLLPNWHETILTDQGYFQLTHRAILTSPTNDYGEYPPSQIVLLTTSQGHISGRLEAARIGDIVIELRKAPEQPTARFGAGVLSPLLLGAE